MCERPGDGPRVCSVDRQDRGLYIHLLLPVVYMDKEVQRICMSPMFDQHPILRSTLPAPSHRPGMLSPQDTGAVSI